MSPISVTWRKPLSLRKLWPFTDVELSGTALHGGWNSATWAAAAPPPPAPLGASSVPPWQWGSAFEQGRWEGKLCWALEAGKPCGWGVFWRIARPAVSGESRGDETGEPSCFRRPVRRKVAGSGRLVVVLGTDQLRVQEIERAGSDGRLAVREEEGAVLPQDTQGLA